VDCEILKRCWESLADENQRLKQELAAMQLAVGRGGGALRPRHANAPERVARGVRLRQRRRAVRLVQLHGGSRGQAARAQVELRRVVEIVGNTVAVRLVDHDGVGHARRPRSLRSMPSASGGRMLRTTTAAATNEPTELHFTAGFIMLQTKLTCSSDANTVNDNDAFVCDGNASLTCSPFPTSI
jgi:hypothetical protein